LLTPGAGTGGEQADARWRVIPNVVVEADL
jgi:hypothetical protein